MEQWFQEEFVRLFNEDAEFHDQVLTCLLPEGNAETATIARKCRRTWFIAPDLMENQIMGKSSEDTNSRRCREGSTGSVLALPNVDVARGDAETPSESTAGTADTGQPQPGNDVSTQVDECSMQPTKEVPHNVAFGSVIDSSCAPRFVDGKLKIQVASRGFQSLWLLQGQLHPRVPGPDSMGPDRPESPLLALVSCRELPMLDGKFSRSCLHCRGTQTWKVNPLYTSRSDTDSNDSWQQEGAGGTWTQESENDRMMEDLKLRKMKRSVDSWPVQRVNVWKISDFREREEIRPHSEAQGQITKGRSTGAGDQSNCGEAELQNREQYKGFDTRSKATSLTIGTEATGVPAFPEVFSSSPYFAIDLEEEDKAKDTTPSGPSQTPRVDIRELWEPSQALSSAQSLSSDRDTSKHALNTASPMLVRSNSEPANATSGGTGDKSATQTKSSFSQNGKVYHYSGPTLNAPIPSKFKQDSETVQRTHAIGLLESDLGMHPSSTGDSISRSWIRNPHHNVCTSSIPLDGLEATPLEASTSSSCTGSHSEAKTPSLQTKTRLSEAEDIPSKTHRHAAGPDQIESPVFSRAVSNDTAGCSSARSLELFNRLEEGRSLAAKPQLFPGHVPRWRTPVGFRPSPKIQWAPPRRNNLERAMQSWSCRAVTSVLADDHDAAYAANISCDHLQSCEGAFD